MSDATAQLVTGPLFRCGFFFSRGVGKDVLRNFFSAKYFLGSRSRLKSKEDES
jgi:hypothetical protein